MAMIFIPAFALLLLQFIIIAIVTRDQRTGFAGILASLPYPTAQLSLARALASLCLLLGLWPLMVLTVGFLPGLEPAAWLFNARDLAALSFHYFILCLIVVGFVFFSSSYTQRPGRLYLIHGIGWFLGVLFDSNAAIFPHWSKLYILSSQAVRLRAPAAALGFFPEPDIFPALIIFQVALSILLWSLATIVQMDKRGERWMRARRFPGMILLAILAASMAGVAVWQGLEHRGSAFRLGGRETDRLQRVIAQAVPNAVPVLESYDL